MLFDIFQKLFCHFTSIVTLHFFRRLWWHNLEIVQSTRNAIEVRDVLSEVAKEKLETRDRITKLQLGYGQLVVSTTRQCYIFSSKNWNTPINFDLK